MTTQALRIEPDRRIVIGALGITQILSWGSTYYLLAVLGEPIARDTGWALPWIVGGLSLGLLVAGLVSPSVGRMIAKSGGRDVLVASSILISLGLIGLALAPALPLFVAAWILIGAGMGAGLYDAAFATLGRLYGTSARQAITILTLIGGFASTVCWPFSAWLVTEFGWRTACLTYALLQLGVSLPLYAVTLPRRPRAPISAPAPDAEPFHDSDPAPPAPASRATLLFSLLAASVTASSAVSATVSVHLLTLLQARDIGLATAVALGAMIGPAQVTARAIEMFASRYHHAIWTLVASAVSLALGVILLWAGFPIVSIGLVFYGAGIGLESIARGTVPLALFSTARYPIVIGRLALPSLVAQSSAPLAAGLLLVGGGAETVFAALALIALAKLAFVLSLIGFAARS